MNDAPRPKGSEQPNRGPDNERLLSLLEAATEGNDLLDAAIVLAVYGRPSKAVQGLMGIGIARVLNFTTSLDAALTLLPAGWSLKLYVHTGEQNEYHADVYKLGEPRLDGYVGCERPIIGGPFEAVCCPSPALAVCIAALQANAAKPKSVPSLSPTQDRGASSPESLPESTNQSETP